MLILINNNKLNPQHTVHPMMLKTFHKNDINSPSQIKSTNFNHEIVNIYIKLRQYLS